MFTQLNLASRPFRNRMLPWTITAVVMCATLVALMLIVNEAHQTNTQAAMIEDDVVKERERASALQNENQKVVAALPADELRALRAAHLLIDRKNFSWSRLMADLEAAVPANVRVESINVRDALQRGEQTYADVELTVIGRQTTDITGMINAMNREGLFDAEPVAQNPPKNKKEKGIEFQLLVRYRPRAYVITAPSAAAAIGDNRQMDKAPAEDKSNGTELSRAAGSQRTRQ